MTALLGEPNDDGDNPWRSTHAWTVTNGTTRIRLYNYEEPTALFMRGNTPPGATLSFFEHVNP